MVRRRQPPPTTPHPKRTMGLLPPLCGDWPDCPFTGVRIPTAAAAVAAAPRGGFWGVSVRLLLLEKACVLDVCVYMGGGIGGPVRRVFWVGLADASSSSDLACVNSNPDRVM